LTTLQEQANPQRNERAGFDSKCAQQTEDRFEELQESKRIRGMKTEFLKSKHARLGHLEEQNASACRHRQTARAYFIWICCFLLSLPVCGGAWSHCCSAGGMPTTVAGAAVSAAVMRERAHQRLRRRNQTGVENAHERHASPAGI
jgi:Flp pilus assembly protein TadB